MKLILSLFLCLVIGATSAQLVTAHNVSGAPTKVVKRYDKVEGSPYYGNGDWYTGTVITQNDQFLTELKIRYNSFEDQLEYLNKNNPFYYENHLIKSFEYSEVDNQGDLERFYFENGFEYGKTLEKSNFVRVLYGGKNVKLLNRIQVVKQKVTPANYGAADYDKFFDTSQAYIVINGEIDKFKINRGAALKAFPSIKKDLKRYIDDELIDFNRVNDLVKVFKFIDSKL